MYLVPIINLFHTLKLGPQSKESANFFNKSWVIDGTMIVEEYLGTSDGEARSPPMGIWWPPDRHVDAGVIGLGVIRPLKLLWGSYADFFHSIFIGTHYSALESCNIRTALKLQWFPHWCKISGISGINGSATVDIVLFGKTILQLHVLILNVVWK